MSNSSQRHPRGDEPVQRAGHAPSPAVQHMGGIPRADARATHEGSGRAFITWGVPTPRSDPSSHSPARLCRFHRAARYHAGKVPLASVPHHAQPLSVVTPSPSRSTIFSSFRSSHRFAPLKVQQLRGEFGLPRFTKRSTRTLPLQAASTTATRRFGSAG